VGIFYFYFFQQWEGFLQILLYIIDERIQTNSFFFFFQFRIKRVMLESIRGQLVDAIRITKESIDSENEKL